MASILFLFISITITQLKDIQFRVIGWICWVEVQDRNNKEAEGQDPGLLVESYDEGPGLESRSENEGHCVRCSEAQTQKSYQADVAWYPSDS